MTDKYICTQCGTCCRWPGYVRMTEKEVTDISQFLKLSLEEFTEKYTRLTKDRSQLSLIECEDGHCIFLDDQNRCMINQVKPKQCRDFPYTWRFPGWRLQCEMIRNPDYIAPK